MTFHSKLTEIVDVYSFEMLLRFDYFGQEIDFYVGFSKVFLCPCGFLNKQALINDHEGSLALT